MQSLKKILILAFLGINYQSFCQCTDLFISEYVEGSYNNKAIEIYNPTSAAISLSNYRIVRYSNGGDESTLTSQYILNLNGTIQPYGTYVLVLDKQDPLGTGQEAPIDSALKVKADTFACAVYDSNATLYHNGNDAITLEKLSGAKVDIIGKIGEDPGLAWTDKYPYTEAAGGAFWTKDQTLFRKSSIKQGVTVNPVVFNAPAEWDSLTINTFHHLKCHQCECDPNYLSINCAVTSISELETQHHFSVFPNPVKDGMFYLKTSSNINSVEIINIIGQPINSEELFHPNGLIKINVEGLHAGMYFIKVNSNNTFFYKKIVIE